jgi:hypothetical protein
MRAKPFTGVIGALRSAMRGFFGTFGDGRTIRAFGLIAAFASLAAVAFGEAADRYARNEPPGFLTSLLPQLRSLGLARPPANAVDYATTGSVQADGRSELVVLGPCSDAADQR